MPKLGEKQDPKHPWCQRRDASIAARQAAVTVAKPKPAWTCPSCGDEMCEFEECVTDQEMYR